MFLTHRKKFASGGCDFCALQITQEVATTGDIIVALLDDFDEVTVKRLKQIANEIILVSDNPKFSSYSSRHHRIKIVGKVTWIKRFLER